MRCKDALFAILFALLYSKLGIIQEFQEYQQCRGKVCAAKGPRPRYPRVWKTRNRIGTISKSAKLVTCIKELSNIKEEIYGALDSFIAWELEFPLVTVKKALKTLENEKEWKRIIQVTKWMLSKGHGRTMGTYFTLLNALAEDGRLDEAEELWAKIFSENLEGTPRIFFDKMTSIYYHRDMYDKMFEVFADMEELYVRPNVSIVTMMGNVFQKLGMLDKYKKLKKKYPPPRWEYRYIRGKRVRIRAKPTNEFDGATEGISKKNEETNQNPNELDGEAKAYPDESFEEGKVNPDELFEEAEANRNELFKEAEAISNENIEANLSS
ncbi:hypothetical protein Pint_17553 [Pistacia integerrima]|uniref:Uncharacterized protein n=1 Tax=Pistacia integerrima TaxID=434235 RepID=A0ACC0YYI4_9ROSI|nr:hypothetical protein Pint_17553 [Pistacia integerrima]